MKRLILLTTLLLLIVGGCENPVDREVIPVPEESLNVMQAAPNENAAIRAAIAVQEAHTPRIMEIPGVVGTGVSKDEYGITIIKVFTEKKGVRNIPLFLNDIPVQVTVTGEFKALEANPKEHFTRPTPIGISTSPYEVVDGYISAGTIGCRVKNGNGQLFVLSNYHVLAEGVEIGTPISQPGLLDIYREIANEDSKIFWDEFAKTDQYRIGELADYVPINRNGNTMDAAIALLDITTNGPTVGTATPADGGYGTPSVTTKVASVGEAVKKYGRTTGLTQGTIDAINATVRVSYSNMTARFSGQIVIVPGGFSDSGDSGSLIVTDNGNHPVALLFAGSSSHTIGSPIQPILDRFGVTIDGEESQSSNTPPVAVIAYTLDAANANKIDFDGTGSYDPDDGGSITAYNWDFGYEGKTGTGATVSHTFPELTIDKEYTVTLTVTDNETATGTKEQKITIAGTGDPTGDIIITLAEATKINRNRMRVNLRWDGASNQSVDIKRNGKVVVSTTESQYSENVRIGTYTYEVCFTGTSNCSESEEVSL